MQLHPINAQLDATRSVSHGAPEMLHFTSRALELFMISVFQVEKLLTYDLNEIQQSHIKKLILFHSNLGPIPNICSVYETLGFKWAKEELFYLEADLNHCVYSCEMGR